MVYTAWFLSRMSADATEWRRLWRALGVTLDRLLPIVFSLPAPALDELGPKVERRVVVPGSGKVGVSEKQVALVVEAAAFVSAYVAEHLPAQVVATDTKPDFLTIASGLAVRSQGGGRECVGSFDLLLRMYSVRSGPWKKYHGKEMALDVKLTGASGVLGLNGPTMRSYLSHARAVMVAARRGRCRVGRCPLLAFLLRRPPGPTYEGAHHSGAFGFVAIDVNTLVQWDPHTAAQARAAVVMHGGLLQRAATSEPLAQPHVHVPERPRARDRWAELRQLSVRPGWVTTRDFCETFDIGAANLKSSSGRVNKRLHEEGSELETWRSGSRGQPVKIARVSSLQRSYPRLV